MRSDEESTLYISRLGLTAADYALLYREKWEPKTILGARNLDAPLRPMAQPAPMFPISLRGKSDKGQAVVEMLIDEIGHVRLPQVKGGLFDFEVAAVEAPFPVLAGLETTDGDHAVGVADARFDAVGAQPPPLEMVRRDVRAPSCLVPILEISDGPKVQQPRR